MKASIRKNISWQRIGDEVLIMDTIYQRKAHGLNSTAAFIWEQLDQTNSADEITLRLCDKYNVSPERAKNDIIQCLNHWQQLELIDFI